MVHVFRMCQGIPADLALAFSILKNGGLSSESLQHPPPKSLSINLNSILNKTEVLFY